MTPWLCRWTQSKKKAFLYIISSIFWLWLFGVSSLYSSCRYVSSFTIATKSSLTSSKTRSRISGRPSSTSSLSQPTTTTATIMTASSSPLTSSIASNGISTTVAEICQESKTFAEQTTRPAEEEITPPMLELKQRLLDAGVPAIAIAFVKDGNDGDDDGDRNGMMDGSDNSRFYKKQHSSMSTKTASTSSSSSSCVSEEDTNVVEIKTLIWEVTYRQQQQRQQQQQSLSGKAQKSVIVTACRIDDKIEVRRLREILQQEQEVYDISLAPLHVAEDISGFPSGSIPPIGHRKSFQISKLVIDSKVATDSEASTSSIGNQFTHASVGSGKAGYSLILPISELFTVAESEPYNVHVESITATDKDDLSSKGGEELVTAEMDGEMLRRQRKMERIGRQPKPKDRLKEYRRMKSTIDRAKLLRTTARKKGRVDEMRSLVTESIEQGDFPHMFSIHPEEQFSKHCLHVAAWRGDFETVQLLIETSKQLQKERRFDNHDLDIINTISRGGGNYGKTAIFYALTQCREVVVRYLVAMGANLLIVNNKGQTPCSIAVSHVDQDVCELLYAEEARQLRAGGKFVNYRESNSDEKLYGDLDPRFPIDDANQGGDIQEARERYSLSVSTAEPSTIIDGVPTDFLPRSLRGTIRWWNRPENVTLAEIQKLDGSRSLTDGSSVTFTQPREIKKKKQTQSDEDSGTKGHSSLVRLELPYQLNDSNTIDILTVDQVLSSQYGRSQTHGVHVIVVNGTESIDELANNIRDFIRERHSDSRWSDDAAFVSSVWGIDCEWKPGDDRGKNNPVATLQLSTASKAYVIDVQSICQNVGTNNVSDLKAITPTETELKLDSALSMLFTNMAIPLIGFGIFQDLGKLAASFPHLPCFSKYNAVVDLQTVNSVIYSRSTRPLLSSLQKMVALLLGKQLDKTQQCSDWTSRPLSAAQMNYATLDAAVLPLLLKTMIETSQTVDRYNGQFFSVHENNILCCVRYVLLNGHPDERLIQNADSSSDETYEWNVPMGSIRTLLGRRFARQFWHVNQQPPDLPNITAVNPNRITKKEAAHQTKVGDGSRKKAKPIQLCTLSGDINNLPIPGTTLGYTKESCVYRVIGHNFMNTLPEGTYIGFNRRSGVVETQNAWILFCNFGSSSTKLYQKRRQTSEFSHGGRFLDFNLNPRRKDPRSSEKTLLNHVLSKSSGTDDGTVSGGNERKVLLFVRDGTSSKFLFCGECKCRNLKCAGEGTSVDLFFELLDYEVLIGKEKISSTFTDLVKWREGFYLAQNEMAPPGV